MFCELEFYKAAIGKITLSANCGSTFKSEAATGMAVSLKNLPQSCGAALPRDGVVRGTMWWRLRGACGDDCKRRDGAARRLVVQLQNDNGHSMVAAGLLGRCSDSSGCVVRVAPFDGRLAP
jgi:hypothetical protein